MRFGQAGIEGDGAAKMIGGFFQITGHLQGGAVVHMAVRVIGIEARLVAQEPQRLIGIAQLDGGHACQLQAVQMVWLGAQQLLRQFHGIACAAIIVPRQGFGEQRIGVPASCGLLLRPLCPPAFAPVHSLAHRYGDGVRLIERLKLGQELRYHSAVAAI